jgi:hypothetical protein
VIDAGPSLCDASAREISRVRKGGIVIPALGSPAELPLLGFVAAPLIVGPTDL